VDFKKTFNTVPRLKNMGEDIEVRIHKGHDFNPSKIKTTIQSFQLDFPFKTKWKTNVCNKIDVHNHQNPLQNNGNPK
jgi:hypothetical protein